MTVEICCSSLASVHNAIAGEAHRIELCADLLADGLTPGADLLEAACAAASIPIHVLIRPRPGDFVYTPAEWEQMRREMELVRHFPVQGVVIGALDGNGRIPVDAIRSVMDLGRGLDLTFHRAFDRAADPFETLEILADLGFDRVLTSGQQPTALQGLPLLTELKQRADGRLVVMPGGGVTDLNCGEFFSAGFREIHLSARTKGGDAVEPVADSAMVRRVVEASRVGG